MTPTVEAGIRSFMTIVALGAVFAGLTFLSNMSDLTFLSGNTATVIASIAAVLLSMLDKVYSPNGTVAFGSIGKAL